MTTPMFQQYERLKSAHPNTILFFRMGDFYEMFYEDAEVAARELEITLTSRNKKDPTPIPMAGIPHHAATRYIQTLIEKGYRVAIAEQVEDPAKSKGLVDRAVVRVVTPGIVLDPTALEANTHNFLVGISSDRETFGLCFLDCSTGTLRVTETKVAEQVRSELERYEPKEILIEDTVESPVILDWATKSVQSDIDSDAWSPRNANSELHSVLQVNDLKGFGIEGDHQGGRAAGALLRYARESAGSPLSNICRISAYHIHSHVVIDSATRRNLELTRTLIGKRRKGSLLGVLDRTQTPMGSRMILDWLLNPLIDCGEIRARQGVVGALVGNKAQLAEIRSGLKPVSDMERMCARIAQGSAQPRDLSALVTSLKAATSMVEALAFDPIIKALTPADLCENVLLEVESWLVPEPPLSMTEGGLIREGAHEELDELVRLTIHGMSDISGVEEKERQASGIPSLKIRRNRVFGYFIEITRAHLHKVPERYLRKQTLTNAERYITPELKELEERVLGADERRKALEYALFCGLRDRINEELPRLLVLAEAIARIDTFSALADAGIHFRWTCPEVTDERIIEIEKGRHPVVEALMDEERFVPNDVILDSDTRRLIILTGPNMSGKSTIMRQVALIVILAQMGSYVPVKTAKIGLVDRVFTRVGASDDLTQGQSTFMLEMSETAAILHNATEQSLVLLDEIGRGTSTYDGLAIAWAVAEDITDRIHCRTIFATHYHELCELAGHRKGVFNQSVSVSENGEQILFLRKLKDGGASRSYGVQCARLAGIPKPVVVRAKALLSHFEKIAPHNDADQLSLFGTAKVPEGDTEGVVEHRDKLREALGDVAPDEMSPKEALDILYSLQDLI